MPSPPSWDTLADRAHKDLSTVSTLTASIHIYGPRQNDPYGEPVESTVNVWFSGPGLWRIERNGELIVMRERARHLTKVSPGVMQQRQQRGSFTPIDELGGLGWTHRSMFTAMSGFDEPTEAPTAVTVAGRGAWQVVLAAKKSKPFSLEVAFDHETGLLVRYAALGTDFITEVTHLAINQSLPLATFVYDGPLELEELPVIDVDLTDGLWVRVETGLVDDGEFPQCGLGDRIQLDGFLFRTTRLKAVESMKGASEITTTYEATPKATYQIRAVCRAVIEPMTLRLDVAGLDLAAEPGTYRDVSPSGNGEMFEAYSEDFEAPEPGQLVEAEGYFVVPWSHTWDDWGGGQPTHGWTVLDIWAARRHKSIGPWANRIPAGIDADNPPRVKQWQNVKAFWVKLAPLDD